LCIIIIISIIIIIIIIIKETRTKMSRRKPRFEQQWKIDK